MEELPGTILKNKTKSQENNYITDCSSMNRSAKI